MKTFPLVIVLISLVNVNLCARAKSLNTKLKCKVTKDVGYSATRIIFRLLKDNSCMFHYNRGPDVVSRIKNTKYFEMFEKVEVNKHFCEDSKTIKRVKRIFSIPCVYKLINGKCLKISFGQRLLNRQTYYKY